MCFALCHTNDVNVLIHFINYNARAHKMYVCDVNVSLAGTLALSDHWLIDRNIQGQHILAHDGTHTFRSIDGQPAQYHSTIRMKFNNLMPYCVRFSSFPVTTVRKERKCVYIHWAQQQQMIDKCALSCSLNLCFRSALSTYNLRACETAERGDHCGRRWRKGDSERECCASVAPSVEKILAFLCMKV